MYSAIGHRIRHLRRERNMTQEQLAEKSAISLSFLGHIERGTRKLSVETLYKIILALDCSADEILGTGKQGEVNLRLLLSSAIQLLGTHQETLIPKNQ